MPNCPPCRIAEQLVLVLPTLLLTALAAPASAVAAQATAEGHKPEYFPQLCRFYTNRRAC
jgi:hypothetical protein